MAETVWTEELVERLKALWELKHSSAEIARTLQQGLTRSAVLGKAHRLKLPRHPNGHNPTPRPYKTFARVWMAAPNLVKPEQAKPLNLTLFDLEPHHCRFRITDETPYLFCGIAKQAGSSYCPHHHQLTHGADPRPRPVLRRQSPSLVPEMVKEEAA